MSLSRELREELHSALMNAFPNIASLDRMLDLKLDKNLQVIVGEDNLDNSVLKLIRTANSQGWIEDLVDAACKSNPGNPRLRDFAGKILAKPEAEPCKEQNNQLRKILILAAIPHGLRLDKEIREIQEAIRGAVNQSLFEISIRTAVRTQDIRRAIAEEKPQIVHFCGHGLEDGSLLLEDNGGNNKPVPPDALASLFELHTDYVQCVLLNACHSEKTAIAIRPYISYVIGMNQPIEDKAAIAFAQGFYDGLVYQSAAGNQISFEKAFAQGMVAIKLEKLSQGSIPVLKKKV